MIELRESTFYNDLSKLSPSEVAAFKATYRDATYNFSDFKTDVLAHLNEHFKGDVDPGKKAICIKPRGNRRSADVIVCVEHRKYRKCNNSADADFEPGICFFTTDSVRIINYPKQHSANATAKHQDTSDWFKPMVRIFKNMRNNMVADSEDRSAPKPRVVIDRN